MSAPYEIKVDGDKLIITVDISKRVLDAAPMSKSGKSKLVATTSGFERIGPVKVSFNVIC